MTQTTERQHPRGLLIAVCRELTAIARQEEQTAASEAAQTPYWSAYPPSVVAHRQAAQALRENVQRLEARARRQQSG